MTKRTKSVHYNMKNNHEMEKKPTAKKQAIQVHPEHTERCKATRKTNQKRKTQWSQIQNTSKPRLAILSLNFAYCRRDRGLSFATIALPVDATGLFSRLRHWKLAIWSSTKTTQLCQKTTTVTRNGTHAELAYFLKSALNSPKAAPVLEEVGVLSWPASTAASAPPWSLYETPVDMLSFKTNGRQRKLTRLFLRAMKCS